MGWRDKIKKYKDYETKELARRFAKKRRIKVYGVLADAAKKRDAPKRKGIRLTARGIVKAIDNPYGTKFPKAKKTLKKVKKKRLKQRRKTVIIYR